MVSPSGDYFFLSTTWHSYLLISSLILSVSLKFQRGRTQLCRSGQIWPATPSQWPWGVSSLWGWPRGSPRPSRARPRPRRRTRWPFRAWGIRAQGQEAQSFKILNKWKVGRPQNTFRAITHPFKSILPAIQWPKANSPWPCPSLLLVTFQHSQFDGDHGLPTLRPQQFCQPRGSAVC